MKALNKMMPIIAVFIIAILLSACSLTYNPEDNSNPNLNNLVQDLGERSEIMFEDDVQEEPNTSEETTTESVEERKLIKYTDEEVDESDVSLTLEVIEGELIDLQPKAIDPDKDNVEYAFSGPFNDAGLWQTRDGDEGRYLVTVSATDGDLITKEYVLIKVSPRNKEPVIECPEEITVFESEKITIDCNVYDKEDDAFTVVYTGWMTSEEYTTTHEDAGAYTVQLTVTDEHGNVEIEDIKVYVKDKNRLPIVEEIKDIQATETDVIILDVRARDQDGDALTITYFEPFDEDGVWRTVNGDDGTHEAFVKVSDGIDTVTERFQISINNINTAPVLTPIPMIVVNEGEEVIINVEAQDPEGDELTTVFSGWMTSNKYTTTHEDAGTHYVDVTVSDGRLETTQTVKIQVNNINRPPVFVVPG